MLVIAPSTHMASIAALLTMLLQAIELERVRGIEPL